MKKFENGEIQVLVSTSVIEVGVDVPNATMMVIENSERFGLSQLHQFRGRIGRNDMQSYCFLHVGNRSMKEKARLKAMVDSDDGFYLSEVDLRLRGAGEMYGVRQSGLVDLKIAKITDTEMMVDARASAEQIFEKGVENYPLIEEFLQNAEVYAS